MDLQHLRALVVLHEEGQFLRASRRLQISQPGPQLAVNFLVMSLLGKLVAAVELLQGLFG